MDLLSGLKSMTLTDESCFVSQMTLTIEQYTIFWSLWFEIFLTTLSNEHVTKILKCDGNTSYQPHFKGIVGGFAKQTWNNNMTWTWRTCTRLKARDDHGKGTELLMI